MVVFECAGPQDVAALADLLALLLAQEAEFTPNGECQRRGLAAIVADPAVGHVLTARRDGRIVAMVTLLYTVSTALGTRVALLEDMVVDPAGRGQGVGGAIAGFCRGFRPPTGLRPLDPVDRCRQWGGAGLLRQTRLYPFPHDPHAPPAIGAIAGPVRPPETGPHRRPCLRSNPDPLGGPVGRQCPMRRWLPNGAGRCRGGG